MTDPTIKPGQRVEIIHGPFAGGQARVQGVDGQQVHLVMLVLGQETPFTVRLNQVRPAELQVPMTDTDQLPVHHH